jgi:N-acetylneuraminic acid mutarotase
LVFSGDEGKTFHQTEVLLMQIAREKDPDKKQQLIAKKDILQRSHPGYNGNVLCYNTHTDKWKKIDSIPFPGQVTTTALKWDNEIVIPCGEIRAGVRTPEIILGKD